MTVATEQHLIAPHEGIDSQQRLQIDGALVTRSDIESDDFLPLGNVQRLRRLTQPQKKGGQGFGQA